MRQLNVFIYIYASRVNPIYIYIYMFIYIYTYIYIYIYQMFGWRNVREGESELVRGCPLGEENSELGALVVQRNGVLTRRQRRK